jgi:hypothetical protein
MSLPSSTRSSIFAGFCITAATSSKSGSISEYAVKMIIFASWKNFVIYELMGSEV